MKAISQKVVDARYVDILGLTIELVAALPGSFAIIKTRALQKRCWLFLLPLD